MARVTYKGFNLPDGAAIPDVPADLRTLVDGGFPPRFANQAALDAAGMNVVGEMAVLLDAPLRTVIYDGAVWVPFAGLGTERTVAESILATNRGAGVTTAETVIGPTLTFTVLTGRQYYIKWGCRLTSTQATTATLRFRQNNAAGTGYCTFEVYPGGNVTTGVSFIMPMTGLPLGAFTLCVTLTSSLGTATVSGAAGAPNMFAVIERVP